MDLFEEYRHEDKKKSTFSNFAAEQSTPMFSLKKLDWERLSNKSNSKLRSRVILKVASSNNVIIIATNECSLLRWNLADGSKEPDEVKISSKPEDSIEQIFIDPTGSHIIVSLRNFDNYYLNNRMLVTQRPKKIFKLQGLVECIAFDRQNATENSTKTFLIGTSNGMIFEASLDSTGKEIRTCNCVYQLEKPVPITSIYFEVLSSGGSGAGNTGGFNSDGTSGGSGLSNVPVASSGGISGWSASAASALSGAVGVSQKDNFQAGGGSDSNTKLFVMCATSSPTRMYHFIGGPTFDRLFADYVQSGTTSFTELPGEIRRAELHCYGKSTQTRAQNFALMTEMGVYHGSLLFTNTNAASSGSENVLLEAQLLPFVAPQQKTARQLQQSGGGESDAASSLEAHIQQQPKSIAVSEFHFLILLGDRLQIMSRLSGRLVQEELLRPGEGVSLGLVRDTTRNATWLYSTSSIFQVITTAEDRHVWSIYLNKALAQGEERLFDVAFEHSKSLDQKHVIMRSQADFLMSSGRKEKAAACFAKSGLSFDEVVLRLINCTGSFNKPQTPPSLSITNGSATAANTNNVSSNSLSTLDDLRGLILSGGTDLTPLRIYLAESLKTLPSGAKSQRTMLCTWLCEIYLHQISAAAINASASASTTSASVSAVKPQSKSGNSAPAPAAVVPPTEAELTAQFKDFLRMNKLSLDQSTTFSLIISRNNRPLLLFFAQIAGDYHRVVGIYVTDRRYGEAIAVLRDAPFEKVAALIYKTAPVLIVVEPDATVNMLLAKSQLSVSGLLPALLRYSNALDRQLLLGNKGDDVMPLDRDFEGGQVNFAIRYLRECLDRLNLGFSSGRRLGDGVDDDHDMHHYDLMGGGGGNNYSSPEPVLFHTLIWLLAKYDIREGSVSENSKNDDNNSGDNEVEGELFSMLSHMQELRMNNVFAGFDLDYEYVLRQCRLHHRPRSAVIALLLLDAPSEAVREALKIDVVLAKQIAASKLAVTHSAGDDSDGPNDSDAVMHDLRKSLWLTVAKHVIAAETDMTRAIALIRESDGVLSIDDLLPHLPDFTEIDLFKEDICASLEGCGHAISALKGEMDELAETADSTVRELESMKNRAYSMGSHHQRCEYCPEPLFAKQQSFYLFPCSHGFHCQCLLRRAPLHLRPAQLSAVLGIEEALKNLAGRLKDSDTRARAQQEALQLELDGYIAADCPLCGFVMIQSLGQSLIGGEEDAAEAKSWEL